MSQETFNPEAFNEIFSHYNLSECANCESQIEVLRTVQFVMEHCLRDKARLSAIEEALKLRCPVARLRIEANGETE